MIFEEALKEMRNKKSIRRISWSKNPKFYYISKITNLDLERNHNGWNLADTLNPTLTVEDIISDDWEIVEQENKG